MWIPDFEDFEDGSSCLKVLQFLDRLYPGFFTWEVYLDAQETTLLRDVTFPILPGLVLLSFQTSSILLPHPDTFLILGDAPTPPHPTSRRGAPRAGHPEERLDPGTGMGPADAASLPLPWPGPPRCRGAGGINQDNEATACHAPRGH